MSKLWQHPNGVFYILHGERLRERTSTRTKDRREAEARLARFILERDTAPLTAPTIEAILVGYMKDRTPHVRSPETIAFSVKGLLPHLGALQPQHLLPKVIQGYAKGRDASAGTILREIGVLRAALAWAAEHRWITAAPHISNPVKTPPPRDRWLTRDEARRLIEACHEPHIKAFVMLGLMTAARTGAILELRWEQVKETTIDYGPGHGNKRRAVVPLNDELRHILGIVKALGSTEYVIERHGKRVVAIKKGFGAACRRAGLKDVTPHILRHTAATWMAMSGVPMREIAKMLGDEEATVERVYAKHNPEYLRRAASALQFTKTPSEGA